MNETFIKLFIGFIIGGLVMGFGLAISLIEIVLLGVLLSGVTSLGMLVVVLTDR